MPGCLAFVGLKHIFQRSGIPDNLKFRFFMPLGHSTVVSLYKDIKQDGVNSYLEILLCISEPQGLLCCQRRASDEFDTICSQLACFVCLVSFFSFSMHLNVFLVSFLELKLV